jgi:hypothetical protein
MGQGLGDLVESAIEEERKRWHGARAATVADADAAYQRGRQIYADAIRTGQNVLARTPQEVRALGGAVDAGVRSAGNAVSLGLADNADAATGALLGAGGPGGFGQRYHNQLAAQHDLDRQAAKDHPYATAAGNVLGTVGAILVGDEPAAAGVVARLFPGAAKTYEAIQGAKRIGFIPEGLGTMSAVGGGAFGGATQLASDAAQGRSTSLRDFAGAVGGGALGGYGAARRGPVLGAAIGGGSTAALQGDDLDGVMRDATASAYGGRILGPLGEQVSNSLPRSVKGAVGEGLSFLKARARGEPIPQWPTDSPLVGRNFPLSGGQAGGQQPIPLSKSYTQADWLTGWGRALEAKFGVSASLTAAQGRARAELGDLYLPDHWLPSDVGNFAGGWLGPALGESAPDDGSQW